MAGGRAQPPVRTTRRRAEGISQQTTARLSVYQRCLGILEDEGIETISSRRIAERFQLNSDQIRKDLAHFGEFGIRGIGYSVGELRRHLVDILGLARALAVVVVGAGRLGTALADYPGFNDGGLKIVGVFDIDPAKIGCCTSGGVTVLHLDHLPRVVREKRAEIAIVAVPPHGAPEVAERVVASGIKAILNFAPIGLRVPRGVRVQDVDLKREMDALAFFLKQPHPKPAARPGEAYAVAHAPAARGGTP